MKSRRISLVAVLLLALAVSVQAQTTAWSIDGSTHVKEGEMSSLVGIFPTYNFESNLGVWGYAGLTPTWAELLVGPSLHVTIGDVYLEGGFGGGVEQYVEEETFTPRFGAYGLVSGDTYSFFGFVEYGEATSWWYLFQGLHKVAGPVSAGVHGQRFMGIGPRVQLDIGPAYIWTARVYDPELAQDRGGFAIGAGFVFSSF